MVYSAEYKAAIADNSDTMSFLTTSTAPTSCSQPSQVRLVPRKRLNKKWIAVIVLFVLILLAIIASALIVLLKKETAPTFDRSRSLQYNQQNPQNDNIFVIEFTNAEQSGPADKIVVNTDEQITETIASKLNVRANFKTRVSLHKLEIASNLIICLVKNINREVEPAELKDASRYLSSIKVNSSETFIITSKPVSSSIRRDLETSKFCPDLPLYMMEEESSAQHAKISVDKIITEHEASRYRRDIIRPPDTYGDIHNNNTRFHCGGPIGRAKRSLLREYTCTKKQSQCYRRLTNERCDECYHGHNLRTRGCWCPITAIQTCIKISWRPDTRCCTSVYSSPCVYQECARTGVTREPVNLPKPIIKVRIIHRRTTPRYTWN